MPGAAALVPSAPVASSGGSNETQAAFTRSLVTTAIPPPQYSALPAQLPLISGINVPLPLSPDQVGNDGLANVETDDDNDDVFELHTKSNYSRASITVQIARYMGIQQRRTSSS